MIALCVTNTQNTCKSFIFMNRAICASCNLVPFGCQSPHATRGQGMTTGSSGITVMSATVQSPCRHPEMVGNRVRKPDPAWYEKREAHHLVLHDETTKKWQAIRESQIQPQAAAWKGTFLCRKL